jgi:putative protein-disulfide isomerase
MLNPRTLWYFADPMCSWCYGFTPAICAIEDAYGDKLALRLILGGLRPGNTEPMDAKLRDMLLHHWHEVQQRTGQPFKFEGAMPDGFVYDTEPPSRAVVAAGEIDRAVMLPYFKSIQYAFYAEQQDVTQPDVLAAIAVEEGIERQKFLALFNSGDVRERTQANFYETQRLGIRGFPAVVLQDDEGATLLALGYQPFEELKPAIDKWLEHGGSALTPPN